jgi:hypothetical protein
MNPEDRKPVQPSGAPVTPIAPITPAAPEKPRRSGEGAATALQALIRKRRQVESHDDTVGPEPESPLP